MTTTSADSSGNYEKRRTELSQSCCSSGLNYLEDTSEPSARRKKPAGNGQSEVADSAAIERDVRGRWIDPENKEAGIKQDKSVITTHAEITELLDRELDALWSYCTIKITKMRQQLLSKQANGGKSRKLQRGFTAKKLETSDLNCIVPDQLMNRIRLKNIRETVKQVTEAQIHESSACPDCQKKKAELAEVTFLRHKKILMESALIQEKLEEHIYSRDVLTLIGEALRSFPKPSEDPTILWQRMKGQKVYVLKVVNVTQGRKELGESSVGSRVLNASTGGYNLFCQ